MASRDFAFDSPLTLPCGLVLRNRVVRAAAFAGGSVAEQAAALGEAARGGAALVTVAYSSVSRDGRTFAAQLLLDPAAPPAGLAEIARSVHDGGALVVFQLTHAGSFSDPTLTGSGEGAVGARPPAPPLPPPAPSALFEPALLGWPRACSEEDIARLERDFAGAARLACAEGDSGGGGGGGADGVELHLGHGYLLSQWLSPKTNVRTDAHGGSAARLRFPMRVVRAVRAAIGARKALFVKLNVDDGFAGGVAPADVAATVRELCAEPGLVDGLVPSGGWVSKNGFFMLRGTVPRGAMARAFARTGHLAKAAALAVLGRWLVPEIPFRPGFLLDGARAVLREARAAAAAAAGGEVGRADAAVPVIAIGGFVSLADVEVALAEGFAGVQMARALIREPALVRRWRRHAEARRRGGEKEGEGDGSDSPCSHCNACTLAALAPDEPARCVERAAPDVEEAAEAGAAGVGRR